MIPKNYLTVFCVFISIVCVSQNNICTSNSENVSGDLNSIGKCAIENFKKSNNKEYMKVSTIATRNRFVRNRKTSYLNKLKKRIEAIPENANLTMQSVENIPLFKNCTTVSFQERLQCFNEQISEHISTNLIYPEEALQSKIEDKVSITFIINKKGDIKDVKAVSAKKNKLFENEAKRIVTSLPKFIPAQHEGVITDIKHEIHIDFELSNGDENLMTSKEEGIVNNYLRFDIVNEAPVFVNCANYSGDSKQNCVKETIVNNILENLIYPFDAASEGIEGRIWVRFIVDKDGYVTNITTKGPENGTLLEEEAKRLVKLLPKFVPGKHNTEYVNVEYFLPIDFQLNE